MGGWKNLQWPHLTCVLVSCLKLFDSGEMQTEGIQNLTDSLVKLRRELGLDTGERYGSSPRREVAHPPPKSWSPQRASGSSKVKPRTASRQTRSGILLDSKYRALRWRRPVCRSDDRAGTIRGSEEPYSRFDRRAARPRTRLERCTCLSHQHQLLLSSRAARAMCSACFT